MDDVGKALEIESLKVVADLKAEMTEEAVERLAALMNDQTFPAVGRVAAASAILDLGHGEVAENEV